MEWEVGNVTAALKVNAQEPPLSYMVIHDCNPTWFEERGDKPR